MRDHMLSVIMTSSEVLLPFVYWLRNQLKSVKIKSILENLLFGNFCNKIFPMLIMAKRPKGWRS